MARLDNLEIDVSTYAGKLTRHLLPTLPTNNFNHLQILTRVKKTTSVSTPGTGYLPSHLLRTYSLLTRHLPELTKVATGSSVSDAPDPKGGR